MRAVEFVVEYKKYPTEDYEGLTMSMEEKNGQLIVRALNDWGVNELGYVIFNIDGDELDPQDLEVDERYRGQGIAKVMYDYVKSHGFVINRSYDQTDAGAGFWNKHRGEDVRVWEGADNLNYIGNCTDDDVIEHLFGDATGFAQAVEEHGDEFELDDLVVKYDPETDIHSFYYKQGALKEGWKDWVAGAAMGAAALGAHGDAEAAAKKHQVNKPAVVQQVKMQKISPEQSRGGESPANLKAYVEAMAQKYLPANQVAQFVGQVAHETANFTSMIEQNPEKNLKHYAKSTNPLGNKGIDDAQKYIGRGFLQITGKYNYKHFGDMIRPGFGDELLANPNLAMRKDVAIALAVMFWRERVAPKMAAGASNKEIATAINGRKPKGLASRAQAVKMAAANQRNRKT